MAADDRHNVRLWPVAIIEDRYSGTYSGGKWIAVAKADLPDRLSVVWEGAHGGDIEAMTFWDQVEAAADFGNWIAVGNTPDEALAKLRAKNP